MLDLWQLCSYCCCPELPDLYAIQLSQQRRFDRQKSILARGRLPVCPCRSHVRISFCASDQLGRSGACTTWVPSDSAISGCLRTGDSSRRWASCVPISQHNQSTHIKAHILCLEKFGASFMMVRSDIGGNINRLAQKLAADPAKFASLFTIVLDDIEKGDTGGSSCTKGLLWLKR